MNAHLHEAEHQVAVADRMVKDDAPPGIILAVVVLALKEITAYLKENDG